MNLEFNGTLWYWRGPAPWYFVSVPAQQSHDLQAIAKLVTYGWGVIPAYVQIGNTEWRTSLFPKDGRFVVPIKASVRTTEWRTSLFPKDGRFVVPIKASVRTAEQLQEGKHVMVRLDVR